MFRRRANALAIAVRAALAVATWAAGAKAAGSPEEESPPSFDEELVVRAPARLVGGARSAGGVTVMVVDRRQLDEAGVRTLPEALQRLAGVHVTDEQGNPFQQALAIRGLSASPITGVAQGVSVFVDGVRVNEPAVEEVNFDLVPLEDVERIEIVQGPNAVFGRNTLGAAVHVITRRGGGSRQAAAHAQGGSFGFQSATGHLAGPLGPLDGYASVYRTSASGWRRRGAAEGLRAFGKLGLRRGGADAALSYQYQVDRVEQPGSIPLSLLAEDRTANYTAGDFFRPELHLVTLNARRRLAPSLSLAANAFLRALDAEQFNASEQSPDNRLFNSTRSLGGALQLEHVLRLGPARSRLAAGIEATRSAVRVDVRLEPNARFDATDEGLPLPTVSSDVADAQVALAAFVQEELSVTRGPLAGLAATAALRADRISHAVVDRSPDAPGKATGDVAFDRLVPAAGLSWSAGPRFLASASFARGFRAPAFLELTCADPEDPCIGLQAGVAPDTSLAPLRPVRSRTVEAGVRIAPSDDLSLAVSAFRVDLRDDIFSVSIPGTNRVVFQNVGATRRQGLEATVRARRGPLELAGRYALTRATFETALELATARTGTGLQAVRRGAELPLTPRHRAGLECGLQATRWLRLGGGATFVSAQRLRGDEANEAAPLEGYLLLVAGAEARWRAWALTLDATNLLDREHEVFGTYSVNARAAGEPVERFVVPGAPLRVVAGLRWELE